MTWPMADEWRVSECDQLLVIDNASPYKSRCSLYAENDNKHKRFFIFLSVSICSIDVILSTGDELFELLHRSIS